MDVVDVCFVCSVCVGLGWVAGREAREMALRIGHAWMMICGAWKLDM